MNGFDALAPDYDRLRPGGAGWHELDERTLRAAGDARRLLDAGCGTGRFAALAAERLHGRVWAVDASARMLTEARARPGARRVGWRRAPLERLPFRDGWFDAATAQLVIHLVEDRAAALSELARVLGPGGRLVVATFAHEHFHEFFLNPYFPSIPAIDVARFPDPAALAAELEAVGLIGAGVERFDQPVAAEAEDVLERVRGRYISTLRLLAENEYAAGLARLEREVGGGRRAFAYTLRWALVTGTRG